MKAVPSESEKKVVVLKETIILMGKGENRTQSTANEDFAADLNSETTVRDAGGNKTISKGLLVADAYNGGKNKYRFAMGNLWWFTNSTCKGKNDLGIWFHASRLVTYVHACGNFPVKVVALRAAKNILVSDFIASDRFLKSINVSIPALSSEYLMLPTEWCYDSNIFSRFPKSPEWIECGCFTRGCHSGNERYIFCAAAKPPQKTHLTLADIEKSTYSERDKANIIAWYQEQIKRDAAATSLQRGDADNGQKEDNGQKKDNDKDEQQPPPPPIKPPPPPPLSAKSVLMEFKKRKICHASSDSGEGSKLEMRRETHKSFYESLESFRSSSCSKGNNNNYCGFICMCVLF